jgi:hypothetical protein
MRRTRDDYEAKKAVYISELVAMIKKKKGIYDQGGVCDVT